MNYEREKKVGKALYPLKVFALTILESIILVMIVVFVYPVELAVFKIDDFNSKKTYKKEKIEKALKYVIDERIDSLKEDYRDVRVSSQSENLYYVNLKGVTDWGLLNNCITKEGILNYRLSEKVRKVLRRSFENQEDLFNKILFETFEPIKTMKEIPEMEGIEGYSLYEKYEEFLIKGELFKLKED